MKTMIRLAVAAGLLALAAPALAQSPLTSNFDVTANVLASCRFASAPTALGFGDYDPLAADVAAQTTFALRCTPGTDYTISLDGGDNHTGTSRAMAGPGTDVLTYGLFTDAGFADPWGAAGDAVTGTADATFAPIAGHTFTVHGQLLAGQVVEMGSYADNVVVTVDYL